MIANFARLEFELFTKPSKSDFLRVHQLWWVNPQNTQCIPACPVKCEAYFSGVVKIFAFLGLEPRLNIKDGFNGAGKIEYFSKVSIYLIRFYPDCMG
jgi:hypothetical protein